MTSINQLCVDPSPQLSDQMAIYGQQAGQPRKIALSALLGLFASSYQFSPGGLLLASTLYALRRTQGETIALTATPAPIAPFDANGAAETNQGGAALTMNVTTGAMQATRNISAAAFWVALIGSAPVSDVITLALQTGPVGGTQYTSEFQSIQVATGNTQAFHFAGILQNPNNVNGRINEGDTIQLVASSSVNGNLSLARASLIVQPLDGV